METERGRKGEKGREKGRGGREKGRGREGGEGEGGRRRGRGRRRHVVDMNGKLERLGGNCDRKWNSCWPY